jgi:tetratricopeptide (TPR) repeat protein
MSESTADRNPFERLATEFADRLRRGEHPSLTEYVERYPEHADDIRELFPALALVEHYKPEAKDLLGSPAGGNQPDRLGDYRILRYLGEGGMGVVYEAVRESLHSHVALKVMHPQYRNRENYLRRFRTEARSAARLHHTNIVSVFDYGVHGGVCYYAMQYIAGHSLDKILADVRQLRQEKAGFAAGETATLTSGPDGRPLLGEMDIQHGAGCSKTDPSRQTVTIGLLTGRYPTAVPAEASEAGHLEHYSENAASLVDRYSGRLKNDANDAEAYHHRAHALVNLRRLPEAIDDLTRAIRLRPGDAHCRALRGAIYLDLKQLEPSIADLEAALALKPDQPLVRERLSLCCNNRAWELATGPESTRDPHRALPLARRAVELTPGLSIYLNTLGVAQFRAGQYAEAIATLEQSLAAGRGQTDAFDLFFLAMAHHQLGHRREARSCFDRAVRWLNEQISLTEQYARELAAFRAEAEALLAGPSGELPDDVFAGPR